MECEATTAVCGLKDYWIIVKGINCEDGGEVRGETAVSEVELCHHSRSVVRNFPLVGRHITSISRVCRIVSEYTAVDRVTKIFDHQVAGGT